MCDVVTTNYLIVGAIIFVVGMVGFLVRRNLILMFLYQLRYGSLFLHVGVISALFFLGLSMGSMFFGSLFAERPSQVLFSALFCMNTSG